MPEKPIEIQQNTQLKKPTESTEAPIPQIIKSDDNFPNSPLRISDNGDFPSGSNKQVAHKIKLYDPERRLHQKKHFLHDHDSLGFNMDKDNLDEEYESLKRDGYSEREWSAQQEEYFYNDIAGDFDDAFYEMNDTDGKIKEKEQELIAQGMDEDEAYDIASDYVEEMRGAPESFFARYHGMRNYADVNNFLRHGIPDDREFPYDGTLYELGWGGGHDGAWYGTKSDYPYYDEDNFDEDEKTDMIEDYENEVAGKKSNAIAALVYNIQKMEHHILEQPDMPPEMLYRGLHTDDYDLHLNSDPFVDLEIGDIVRDPGFMSTSRKREIAERFKQDTLHASSPGVLMEIFGGGKRKDMGGGVEAEVVFPPLTQLRFVGKGDDGRYMFDQVGYDRNASITESKLQKPQINKLMKKLSDAFLQRMNDFQFEVLKSEEESQEEKPEPKKYDEFRQQLDHDD